MNTMHLHYRRVGPSQSHTKQPALNPECDMAHLSKLTSNYIKKSKFSRSIEFMITLRVLRSQPAAAPSRLCVHPILLPAVVQYHRVQLTSTATVMRGAKKTAPCSPSRQDLEKQHNGSVSICTPLEVLVDVLGTTESPITEAHRSRPHSFTSGPGYLSRRLSPPTPVCPIHLDGCTKSVSCGSQSQRSPTRKSP